MRVIAGSAKRLLLKTIEGNDTRPTTDRIKETLFNMLQYELADSRVLDLFSGSGGIGIEALSRGASSCTFIEQNQKAASCIRENLATTKLKDQAVVMECDVMTGLKKLEEKEESFDYIFMDPPYDLGIEKEVLICLSGTTLITQDTTIIIELSKTCSFDYITELGFVLLKEKQYKTNKHIFVRIGDNK